MKNLLDITNNQIEEFKQTLRSKDAEIALLRKQLEEIKQVPLTGWKGKSKLEFEKLSEHWIVIEYKRKDQFSEPKMSKHMIPNRNVEVLWSILKGGGKEKTSFKEIGHSIIDFYDLECMDYRDLYGNRDKYFNLFYYPCKILDHLKAVKYVGRTIEVLK